MAFVPLGNATEPHAHPHPRYSARLRAMGVHVFPRSTPAGWVEREQLLTVAGKCPYAAILVSRCGVCVCGGGGGGGSVCPPPPPPPPPVSVPRSLLSRLALAVHLQGHPPNRGTTPQPRTAYSLTPRQPPLCQAQYLLPAARCAGCTVPPCTCALRHHRPPLPAGGPRPAAQGGGGADGGRGLVAGFGEGEGQARPTAAAALVHAGRRARRAGTAGGQAGDGIRSHAGPRDVAWRGCLERLMLQAALVTGPSPASLYPILCDVQPCLPAPAGHPSPSCLSPSTRLGTHRPLASPP